MGRSYWIHWLHSLLSHTPGNSYTSLMSLGSGCNSLENIITCHHDSQAYTCKRHILIRVLPLSNAYSKSANARIQFVKSFCYLPMHICILPENCNYTLNMYTWYMHSALMAIKMHACMSRKQKVLAK